MSKAGEVWVTVKLNKTVDLKRFGAQWRGECMCGSLIERGRGREEGKREGERAQFLEEVFQRVFSAVSSFALRRLQEKDETLLSTLSSFLV